MYEVCALLTLADVVPISRSEAKSCSSVLRVGGILGTAKTDISDVL